MTDAPWTVVEADCVEAMRELEANSVDSICTDPPYGIEFMGRDWDRLSSDAVAASWDTKGRTMTDAPQRNPKALGGASASLYRKDNPRCDKCGRAINGRATVKGFKVCECDEPAPRLTAVSARKMQAWHEQWAREAYRVLKPGGHLLAFGGTRTYHRLACAVEDAGFEIRDTIAWMYGSGFPKSLDVGKQIDRQARGDLVRAKIAAAMSHRGYGVDFHAFDKALGLPATGGGGTRDWIFGGHAPSEKNWELVREQLALTADEVVAVEREAVARVHRKNGRDATSIRLGFRDDDYDVTAPATPEAQQWDGWGTALKPSHEPIVVARKPLIGTVAANVLEHGTGALNIDACRIGTEVETWPSSRSYHAQRGPKPRAAHGTGDGETQATGDAPAGRWPANVVLDEEAAQLLDHQSGESRSQRATLTSTPGAIYGGGKGLPSHTGEYGFDDRGGASRFFYTAKASRAERNAGLDGFEERASATYSLTVRECNVCGSRAKPPGPNPVWPSCGHEDWRWVEPYDDGRSRSGASRNGHPTVKPLALMRWLIRLVTPPGGLVLDPFTGSGTTGAAAMLEGVRFLGIERDPDYVAIARARIAFWHQHGEDGLEIVRRREHADELRREVAEAGQLSLLGDVA